MSRRGGRTKSWTLRDVGRWSGTSQNPAPIEHQGLKLGEGCRNAYEGDCRLCGAPMETGSGWAIWTGKAWHKLCAACQYDGRTLELIALFTPDVPRPT